MIERVDAIDRIRSRYAANPPEVNTAARTLAFSKDLTDENTVLTEADRIAADQDTEHRERVIEYFERAADQARGEALKRFRRADILDALRPAFDKLTTRITTAASTIPQGILNLDDAARLGHADDWLQLERDIATWKQTAELISDLAASDAIPGNRNRYPAEYMVEDITAYNEAAAGSSRITRIAAGNAAGRPNLHIPEGPTAPPTEDNRAAAYRANDEDRAARETLGLKN